MVKEIRRKPDGSTTTSVKEYSRAWLALASPIEKATNSKLFAFNPGFQFFRLDGRQSTWTLDATEAGIFAKALLELEQLKKSKN